MKAIALLLIFISFHSYSATFKCALNTASHDSPRYSPFDVPEIYYFQSFSAAYGYGHRVSTSEFFEPENSANCYAEKQKVDLNSFGATCDLPSCYQCYFLLNRTSENVFSKGTFLYYAPSKSPSEDKAKGFYYIYCEELEER